MRIFRFLSALFQPYRSHHSTRLKDNGNHWRLPGGGLLVFLMVGPTMPLAASQIWGRLESGPHTVGFQVVETSDGARTDSKHPNGRPMTFFIWYPAAQTTAAPQRFADYAALVSPADKAQHQWLSTGISGSATAVPKEKLDAILASPMKAVRNAKASRGAFPLALWTMRHETQAAQALLCEYLASYGYVVTAARYAGPPLPMPWAMKEAEQKAAVFETHNRDLAFALRHMAADTRVDADRTAVLTWSYAAEQAAALQMADPRVKLVIGLSSNPLSTAGLYQGNQAGARLDIKKLTAKYVYMTERLGYGGRERTVPDIFKELSASAHFLRFNQIAHGNFNALEGMIPAVFNIDSVQSWSKPGKNAQLGYETLCRASLYFMEQTLKPELKALESSWRDSVPDGFMDWTAYER